MWDNKTSQKSFKPKQTNHEAFKQKQKIVHLDMSGDIAIESSGGI
jgi:hypothetical protein